VPTPVKVQIVFTDFDGEEKKIFSMPIPFIVMPAEKVGAAIPQQVFGRVCRYPRVGEQRSDNKYIAIGHEIDCGH